MIFKTFLSIKYKPEFKILTYLVILSFITSLVGCTASETLRVESENITHNMNYEIVNVIMKDGKVIRTSEFFKESDLAGIKGFLNELCFS